MASVVAQIADAVLGVVRTLDLGVEFLADRTYAEDTTELGTIEAVYVEVVTPATPLLELDTRGSVRYTVDVPILIRKRITGADRDGQTGRVSVEVLDPLLDVVERVAEAMIPDAFAALDAEWQQTDIEESYDRDFLRETGEFLATILVRFTARKALA